MIEKLFFNITSPICSILCRHITQNQNQNPFKFQVVRQNRKNAKGVNTFAWHCMYLSISIYISLFLSLSLCPTISPYLSISIYLCIYLYPSISLSLYLYNSISISLSLYLYSYLYLSLYLNISIYSYIYLSLYLHLTISIYIVICIYYICITFVAKGFNINGCVLSYFEGTANLHCYTSCTLTTLHCIKV